MEAFDHPDHKDYAPKTHFPALLALAALQVPEAQTQASDFVAPLLAAYPLEQLFAVAAPQKSAQLHPNYHQHPEQQARAQLAYSPQTDQEYRPALPAQDSEAVLFSVVPAHQQQGSTRMAR